MSGGASSERDSRADRALRGLSSHEEERAVPGPSIPRYEIRGTAGEGAAAVVYRAWDRELGRPVALKVLKERIGLDDTARARFRREAQLMGGVSHPNVVSVHDAGEIDGRPYLVMELVEGRTLAESCPADRDARVRLLEKVARAVGAAHAKQIVHRDLKPGNILMTPEGDPKVADFGLAHLAGAEHRLTRTGAVLGTPQYMAPEQVEGATEAISPRTDVYALGAILYEAVSGTPPHVGSNLAELSKRIVEDEPSRLKGVPADLETVCLKALAKEPARRYADGTAMADDLGRVLRGEPILARPTSAAYVVRKTVSRHRAAAVALVAALVLGAWLLSRETRSRAFDRLLQEGTAAFERGDAEGALAKFRAAGKLRGADAEAAFRSGRCLLRLGRDDEALEAWAWVVERSPDHAGARAELGRLRATRSFLERVRTLPGDAGWIWVAPGRPWERGFEVEDLRLAAPQDRNSALLLEAMTALGEGRWAEAAAALKEVPADPDLAGLRGAAAYFARDLEGAEREFSRALAGRPREEWRRLRSHVRTLARNFAGAEADGAPTPDGLPMKGLLLWLRSDHGHAASHGKLHQWLNLGGTALLGPRAGDKEPQWIADVGGGRPAVRFDGKEEGLGLPAGFDDFREGLTAFLVARPAGRGTVLTLGWGSPDLTLEFGPREALTLNTGFANHRRTVQDPAPVPAAGLVPYEIIVEPSGKARLYAGGRIAATGDVPIPDVLVRDKNALGKFPGDLAEILLYRRALSDLEQEKVRKVLASRHFGKTRPAPSDPALPPAGGTGLRAEYFRGTDLSGPSVVRMDPQIRFNWAPERPPPIGGSGSFSVRWSGRVVPPVGGPVTFSTDTDDGVRLWVDGRLLVNNWAQHSSIRDWGTVELAAGREVEIVMEFYEIVGGANATLSWSLPGRPEEVIPAAQLFPRP